MSAAHHRPGGQCDECEGFCLVPITPLRVPVKAVEWTCHAATTIKDVDGKVLAECSGHGHYSVHDEAVAAEIERRINAHDPLVAALRDLLSLYDQRTPLRERPEGWEAARAALANANGSAA